jgi:N-acetyl-beta-hexosaminidase
LTWEFFEAFFRDISENFRGDYWHLGNDEVSPGCIDRMPGVSEFKIAHNISSLQQYFVDREHELL